MLAQWIKHPEEIDAARLAEWRALAVQQGRPYCLPEWMLGWWKHAAPPGAELRILLLLDANHLVGVGPFYLDRRFGLRHLRILGAGTSSTVAPLSGAGTRGELASAVRDLMLERRHADVTMLEGVPAAERWADELRGDRLHQIRSLYPVRGWTQANPTLDMPADGYARWFQDKGGKFRARMRRGNRQLDSLGGRHKLTTGADEIVSRLAEFERLHTHRWRSRGGSGVLTPAVSHLLVSFAESSPENLRVWSVDVDGRTISVQVLIAAGGTVSHWLGGFDDSFTQLHPGAGVLSLHAAIEHAWKAGDQRFDFGAGGQEFKYRFADGEYQLEWSGVARARWCTVPARVPALGEATRLAVARRLSPESKRRLRTWRRRIRQLQG